MPRYWADEGALRVNKAESPIYLGPKPQYNGLAAAPQGDLAFVLLPEAAVAPASGENASNQAMNAATALGR